MKRFMNKKVAAIGLAAGLALGAAGARVRLLHATLVRHWIGYDGGTTAGRCERHDVIALGRDLYPGQGTNTISRCTSRTTAAATRA